jgi:hypothetical protein
MQKVNVPPSSMASEARLRLFHSKYAPEDEARRHVDASLEDKHPSLVFIIGGGRNYIGDYICRCLPDTVSVLLQPSAEFDGDEVNTPRLRWSPSNAEPLASVIRTALADERLAGGLALIEWPPVVAQFQETSEMIRTTLLEELHRASADAATSAYWSGRWLRNSLKFATTSIHAATIAMGDAPIVIACAGPGLTQSIDGIRQYRDKLSLWALASAHSALIKAELEPDLVISTDPGYWNGHHLYEAIRHGAPVAMPPSAFAPGRLFENSSIVPLDTGLSFERAALQTLGLPGNQALASGSSAGTALALALASTTGMVGIAGLDLAARSLSDHAAPYAFDLMEAAHAARLKPSFSLGSARILDAYPQHHDGWRLSRSFSTYAATMTVPTADYYRVFRCSDSPVELPMRRATLDQVLAVSCAQECKPTRVHDDGRIRRPAPSSPSARGMLEDMVADAQKQAAIAIERGLPIPYESALLFKALDPGHSARLLAQAARAEADTVTLSEVVAATRLAAERLSDAYDSRSHA